MNKTTRWRKLWRWLFPSEMVPPTFQNPTAQPVVNLLPPFKPKMHTRFRKAFERDPEKIKKAEEKRERKQKRGW